MTFTVILCRCVFSVTNQDLREVALNKRSYQVSTLTDHYGTHAASLANDGSRQTNHETVLNSCAHSLSENNPWWAVDLEVQTLVARVDLTNRGDAYGNNLLIDCYLHYLRPQCHNGVTH